MDDPISPGDNGDLVSESESMADEQEFNADTSPSSASKSATASKSSAHLQKRRRVTRACDECRRKKIKCSAGLPCIHCTVYSYGMQHLFCFVFVFFWTEFLLSGCNVRLQNVHMISLRIVEETRPHNTSRAWSVAFIVPRPYCTSSSLILT